MNCDWNYEAMRKMLAGRDLPAVLVNMNCLDHNILQVRKVAEKYGKNIRIASKSIRVPYLLTYILENGGSHFKGIMCYSVKEAAYLYSLGFDDLLVAYPTSSATDLDIYYRLRQEKADVSLMVDSREQVDLVLSCWSSKQERGAEQAKICIDADMSFRPLGLHLGVYRSSVLSLSAFEALLDYLLSAEDLKVSGIMGYEAQIAGMGEQNPFSPLLNPVKKVIKKLSVKDVSRKRALMAELIEKKGLKPDFFNGGGSGSLSTTSAEPWISEVTVGSGFLQSHLFDYYPGNENKPALSFALQVDRIPGKALLTCKSGGFIASGESGPDKAPVPFLPEELSIVKNEGFGEVQTPIKLPRNLKLEIGDPVFFRPAKAGEIAERFTHYSLIRDNKIEKDVETYRGFGHCFY